MENLFDHDIDKLYAIEEFYGHFPVEFEKINIDLLYALLIEWNTDREYLQELIEKNNIETHQWEKLFEFMSGSNYRNKREIAMLAKIDEEGISDNYSIVTLRKVIKRTSLMVADILEYGALSSYDFRER